MLLKYLRALLARFVSKNETEFISTQSAPSGKHIDLDIPANNEFSYTAPSNGFLNISDKISNGKKGDTQHVVIHGKARFIRFVKMVGGYKPFIPLLWRGLLCLRSIYKPCLRRLSVVRKGGLVIRLCRNLERLLIRSQKLTAGLKFMLLPPMGISYLSAIKIQKWLERLLLTALLGLQIIAKQRGMSLYLYLLKKAQDLTLKSFVVSSQTLKRILFQLSVLSNLEFGGARC